MAQTRQYPVVYVGDSLLLNFTITEDGSAKDLTNATVAYIWKQGTTTSITKTVGSGITVTNAAGGLLSVTVLAADTALTAGTYVSYLTVTDANSKVSTVYEQSITLRAKT